MNSRIFAVFFAGLLAGCAGAPTNYQKHYKASTEVNPGDTLAWLQPGAEAEIVFTEDLRTELEARQAAGYVVIGYSQFTGPMEGDKGLRAQARDSGATLIIKSAVEAGETTKLRRISTRYDGVVYEPVLAKQPERSEEAGESSAEHPRYAQITLYRQTALFLARRR